MLAAKIPATDYIGKSVNMFWDGIFHFFCLVVVLVGIVMLWSLWEEANYIFLGVSVIMIFMGKQLISKVE